MQTSLGPAIYICFEETFSLATAECSNDILMYFVEFCYLFTTMCNKFLLNIHFVFIFFGVCLCLAIHIVKPSLQAQLDAPSDWRPGGRGFNPR